MTRPMGPKRADLVLSGGGVKGIGLVGAVVALMDAGYTAERVSGTSAGSIVGAIVAAASQGQQMTGAEVKDLALSLDYRKFLDPGRWPSFGVTVLPNLPEGNDSVIPALSPLRVIGPPHLLEEVITTVLVGRDQAYLSQPWVSARAIRVDSTEVGFLDFDISDKEVEALYGKGCAAAEKFLETWDWRAYLRKFR